MATVAAPEPVDRLFLHCRELVTLADGPAAGARRGKALLELGIVPDGAVAVRDGRIVAVGATADLRRRFRAGEELDLSGFVVLPGFVDCHTHPVFTATREHEFHQRCSGADYMAIAAAGGGILSSMRAVRQATAGELAQAVRRHLDGFLVQGTTTIEAKSGYGLSTEAEVKSLRVLRDVSREHALTVSPTFLGAHEFPPEYRDDREGYVRLVVGEMLSRVKELCDSCDVFAEPKVFDRVQTVRILSAARSEGLRLRLHADEIEPMGGAELAVEMGADSADHLQRISEAGQERLAQSQTVAVFLPGTSFLLGKNVHPPARAMLERGCAVALATDFNPGTCFSQSMPAVITLACVNLKMGIAECIHAATLNAAASLHLDRDLGSLHPGKRADFVVLDLPSHEALGYAFAGNPVALTVKDGVPVVANIAEFEPDLAPATEPEDAPGA
ncbi:MAG: imidazolonepropionase [Planctomycetes bacterium]|nr:imidazolonepropionase [Planctomycetota bacterium]